MREKEEEEYTCRRSRRRRSTHAGGVGVPVDVRPWMRLW
jgi:hypothetical protein